MAGDGHFFIIGLSLIAMVVLSALRSAIAGLARNPVLLVATAILALLQLPQLLAQLLGPLLASVVSLLFSLAFVVVVPFFQGGLLGMAEEALGGHTRLGTFLDAGRDHYWSMLAAYLILLGALVAFWLVVVVLAVLVGAVLLGSAGASLSNPAVLAVVGLLVAVVVLVYLGVVFFLQFYGQAIVVDGVGTIDGFRRSIRLVRGNLLPTLGYFLLSGVVGVVFGGLAALATLAMTPAQSAVLPIPTLSPGGVAAVAILLVAATALFTAFFMTFSVAFYLGISRPDGRPVVDPAGD